MQESDRWVPNPCTINNGVRSASPFLQKFPRLLSSLWLGFAFVTMPCFSLDMVENSAIYQSRTRAEEVEKFGQSAFTLMTPAKFMVFLDRYSGIFLGYKVIFGMAD